MLNKVWTWVKARWQWGQGYCPACGKKYFSETALHNNDCEICKGEISDLSIWHNWRYWKPAPPEPPAKVLHKHLATATWQNKAKDAVVEKE